MYYTIKLYSDLGKNVIVDHVVLNQKDGKEQMYFNNAIKLLKENPLILVKVSCSLDELMKREKERGDREIGNANEQYKIGLFPLNEYNLEISTSKITLNEGAKQITKHIINLSNL